MDRSPTERAAIALVDLGLFLFALWVCFRYSPGSRQFSADNQIYYYIAERVASGEAPHASLVDHKQQLAAILSGYAMQIGRAFGVADHVGVRALSVPVAAACAPLVRSLASAIGMSRLAAVIAGLAMVGFVDFYYHGAMGVRPKVFMTFFMIASLRWCALQRYSGAGAAAMASYLCWQPAALVFVGLCASALRAGRGLGHALSALTIGSAIVLGTYEFYFLVKGALGEQLFQSYLMPADAGGYKGYPFWNTVVFLWRMGLWKTDAGVVLSSVFVVGLPLAWVMAVLGRQDFAAWLGPRPGALAVLVAGHLALAFTFLDRQAYPDMFFLYPYMALFFAFATSFLIGRTALRAGRVTGGAAAIGLCLLLVGLPSQRLDLFALRPASIERQITAAVHVQALGEQYGPVWAVGCPHLLAHLRMRNHTQFGLLIDPKVRSYMAKSAPPGRQWRPYKDGELPGVILLSRGGYGSKLMNWIKREYTRVEMKAVKQQGAEVWVARGDTLLIDPS